MEGSPAARPTMMAAAPATRLAVRARRRWFGAAGPDEFRFCWNRSGALARRNWPSHPHIVRWSAAEDVWRMGSTDRLNLGKWAGEAIRRPDAMESRRRKCQPRPLWSARGCATAPSVRAIGASWTRLNHLRLPSSPPAATAGRAPRIEITEHPVGIDKYQGMMKGPPLSVSRS